MTSYCPRCDAENPATAASCRACGMPMNTGTMVMAPAKAVARPTVNLRVVRADGGPEAVVPMRSETLTCGKNAEVRLADDPFVADSQARFFFSGARLAIEDVGGGNGLFVRLRHEQEIPLGGELRMGRQRLVLEAVPALSKAADGTVAWGSPDPGYHFRLVQLLEGGARGAAFPLKEGESLLGREQGDVSFPTDGFVSGRHASFKATAERLTVKDLGSSNGTFIRLSAPAFVENGDQFLIGRQLVRVEIQG